MGTQQNLGIAQHRKVVMGNRDKAFDAQTLHLVAVVDNVAKAV